MAEQGIRSRRPLLVGFLVAVVFLVAGLFELQQLAAWRSRARDVRRTVTQEALLLRAFPSDFRAAFDARSHGLARLLAHGQALASAAGRLQAEAAAGGPALDSFATHLAQARPFLNEALARTASAHAALSATAQSVHAARIALPLYRVAARHLAARLEEIGAPAAQVVPAVRLAHEASRLDRRLAAFGRPHALFGGYARALRRKARNMEEATRGLAAGSRRLGIPPVTDPALSPSLRSLAALFDPVARGVGTVLDHAKTLGPIEAAWASFAARTPALRRDAARVLASTRPLVPPFWIRPLVAYAFLGFGLAVLVMLFFGWRLVGEIQQAQRGRFQEARRNQNAILQLLDELAGLADGDLTVQASVTEDITGAIADSVNFAVEQLRGLVRTINLTAVRIDEAARSTNATAQELVQAATLQSRQIHQVTTQVTTMAHSIEQVSANAQQAAQVAQRSVAIAHRGADAVRATIEGMNAIRESIQETAKRIKRLGESSQEIGDIVELINDIAEQTNILALNASIQASAAGEAGRGFAVVADEVQRLAERAGNATRQIETLVKAIQNDTGEAVDSMEKSTSGVVNGAQLAENAGRALSEIETVSGHIATIVKTISEAARQQAVASGEVTNAMGVIQKITTQTTQGTQATVRDIATLTELSSELRRTVAGFKLPEELVASETGPEGGDQPSPPSADSRDGPPELHEEVDLIPELALAGR
jgi:twitching motility protein PilJ